MLQNLFVEQRHINKTSTLSQDVAHHLFTRQSLGGVVVVTDRPSGFMGAVKKQWAKVIMQVQNERSRTLDPVRITALNQQAEHMQRLDFSTHIPEDGMLGEVVFVTPQQLETAPLACETMYVTPVLADDVIDKITAAMPSHGLVVVYTGENPVDDGGI